MVQGIRKQAKTKQNKTKQNKNKRKTKTNKQTHTPHAHPHTKARNLQHLQLSEVPECVLSNGRKVIL